MKCPENTPNDTYYQYALDVKPYASKKEERLSIKAGKYYL